MLTDKGDLEEGEEDEAEDSAPSAAAASAAPKKVNPDQIMLLTCSVPPFIR
jgi:hypothetical protein